VRCVAAVIKLAYLYCSYCTKALKLNSNLSCNILALKKYSYYAYLYKPYTPFLVKFNSKFNSLLYTHKRISTNADTKSKEVAT
jgi:hypothetical protein